MNRGISTVEVTREKCQSGIPLVDTKPSGYFGFAKTNDFDCKYTFWPLDVDKSVVMTINVVYVQQLGGSKQDIIMPGG